jgi:thiol-disulfide isomerase/thioredoxin
VCYLILNFYEMRYFFLVWLSLISIVSFAQVKDSIRIQGTFLNNSRYTNVMLMGFGSDQKIVKTGLIKDSSFNIALPLDIVPGVYRLIYSQSESNGYIDLIVNGLEPFVAFALDANQKETLVFKESVSNTKWYDYMRESTRKLTKIEMLSEVYKNYPDREDKIITTIKNTIRKEKEVYNKGFQSFVKQNEHTWQGDMVVNRPYYFGDLDQLYVIQEYEQRNQYWDKVNTSSERLLNSSLYTDHILNYLRYYMNPQMHFSEEEVELGFKKSSDTIMTKFGKNIETKKFALQYLTKGFKEIGQEKVLQYIDEKYADVARQCQDDTYNEAFEKRLAAYELLKPGMKAPDFDWYNKDGVVKNLKDIDSNKILIVFWASWCSHCQESMPRVNEFAVNNPGTKVLAISLDDDQEAFKNSVKNFPNILHYCDFKKWNSDPVKKYNIVATPSFFLLDDYRRIVDKYSSFEGVQDGMKKKIVN